MDELIKMREDLMQSDSENKVFWSVLIDRVLDLEKKVKEIEDIVNKSQTP